VKTQDFHVSKIFSVEGFVCLITGGGSGTIPVDRVRSSADVMTRLKASV